MSPQILEGTPITVTCYGGEQKPAIALRDLGDVIVVCDEDSYRAFKEGNQEPITVGFKRSDIVTRN